MKICDRCKKSETEVDGDVGIVTYMAMLTQMYSPIAKPREDHRAQVELCDLCVGDVGKAIGEVVEEQTGRAFAV